MVILEDGIVVEVEAIAVVVVETGEGEDLSKIMSGQNLKKPRGAEGEEEDKEAEVGE